MQIARNEGPGEEGEEGEEAGEKQYNEAIMSRGASGVNHHKMEEWKKGDVCGV